MKKYGVLIEVTCWMAAVVSAESGEEALACAIDESSIDSRHGCDNFYKELHDFEFEAVHAEELITTSGAKLIIREVLSKHGLDNRVTARTIGFADLARDSMIFVKVHNWEPYPIAEEVESVAKLNGFRVEFDLQPKEK